MNDTTPNKSYLAVSATIKSLDGHEMLSLGVSRVLRWMDGPMVAYTSCQEHEIGVVCFPDDEKHQIFLPTYKRERGILFLDIRSFFSRWSAGKPSRALSS